MVSNSGFTFPTYFQGFLLPTLSVFINNNKHLQIFMNCGPCAVDSTEQNENLRKMEIKIVLHFKDQAKEHNQPVPVPVQPSEHTERQKPCLAPLQTCNMGKGKWQGCLSKSFPQHCYLSIFSVMNSVITFCNECLPFPFSTVLVLHSLPKKVWFIWHSQPSNYQRIHDFPAPDEEPSPIFQCLHYSCMLIM